MKKDCGHLFTGDTIVENSYTSAESKISEKGSQLEKLKIEFRDFGSHARA